jgi:CBS domain-containing protein
VETVGGYKEFVEKSSFMVLEKLRRQLHNSPTQRIDVLLITSNKRYSIKLLSSYVSTLGIRFIVFQKQGAFDGWMDTGLFNSQLPTQDNAWSYDHLHSRLIGIRQDSVTSDTSAVEVLKAIDKGNTENIAVVDNDKFRFIVNRGNILSKLLTATLFKNEANK